MLNVIHGMVIITLIYNVLLAHKVPLEGIIRFALFRIPIFR
jgi:hypothetical protein